MTVKEKLSLLRKEMENKGIDAFVVYSTDPHIGEYTPDHWRERQWISGFTGSVGTAVITKDKAGIWTDSRYFIQAALELKDSGFTLFKEGVFGTPTYENWLFDELSKKMVVGANALCVSHTVWETAKKKLAEKDISMVNEPLLSKIWTDRPKDQMKKIFTYPVELSGESTFDKVQKIREFIRENEATHYIVPALDEIAWITNLRGRDLFYNPIFTSYLIISNSEVKLFTQEEKLDDSVKKYLSENNISFAPYENFFKEIGNMEKQRIILSPQLTNEEIYNAVSGKNTIIERDSPVQLLKAVKNTTELSGFRSAMKKDAVALVNFFYWLENNVGKEKMTEFSIAKKLISFRAQQKDFLCSSFEEIVGYKGNGAIVHYHADEEKSKEVLNQGTILIDSGAHYREGTTDITRVVPLGGEISDEFKRDYTLVLKGMISICTLKFPKGTCGAHIDAFARVNLWMDNKDYGHGTGHGVGCCSLVHEGPQSIRKDLRNIPLLEGMVCSDEPGIYIEDKYGIRIENLLAVKKEATSEFGEFYGFETLTLCPINTKCIEVGLLTEKERQWINQYHKTVEESISPLVQEPQRKWLEKACKEI